jgi:hypothetical protein
MIIRNCFARFFSLSPSFGVDIQCYLVLFDRCFLVPVALLRDFLEIGAIIGPGKHMSLRSECWC